MPLTGIRSILILGVGAITIDQTRRNDLSVIQVFECLRKEGFRVILVSPNPTTIMTVTKMIESTYIEPINWLTLSRIIDKERPDALLPTLGSITALSCARDLEREGVLDRYGVEMIGYNTRQLKDLLTGIC